MLDRWKSLTPGERLKAQALLAFGLLGMYMLTLYPISSGKYFESEKMLHRRKDRIAKRTKVRSLDHSGQNPQVIARKIEEVEAEIAEVSSAFNELDTGFAPVDSSDVRQQLMLEISTLAERTGVELLSVERKGAAPREGGAVAVPAVDPVLGRPLLELTATSQYGELLDFLQGLKDLSFYTSVMHFTIYSRELKTAPGNSAVPVRPGSLFISLELSI